jgi:hypothetical protein
MSKMHVYTARYAMPLTQKKAPAHNIVLNR